MTCGRRHRSYSGRRCEKLATTNGTEQGLGSFPMTCVPVFVVIGHNESYVNGVLFFSAC